MLVLADGMFFPLGSYAILWGRASRPAGLAPEALEDRFYSQRRLWARRLSQPASSIFQPVSAVPYSCIDVRVRSVRVQEV
jgi:hypothetical protein